MLGKCFSVKLLIQKDVGASTVRLSRHRALIVSHQDKELELAFAVRYDGSVATATAYRVSNTQRGRSLAFLLVVGEYARFVRRR